MQIDKEKLEKAKLEISRQLEKAEKDRLLQRLQKGVDELAGHNFAILANDQFVEELTEYLCSDQFLTDREKGSSVVENIGAACCSEDKDVRSRALVILSVFSEFALENDEDFYIRKLSNIYVNWLKVETIYLPGFGVVCQKIQNIGSKLLTNKCWVEADKLLITLNSILDGRLKKNNVIKGMIAKVSENIASKNVLIDLTKTYLDTLNRDHKKAGTVLKNLGRRAVIFLLNKMMHSTDRTERFRLMGLIPQTGASVRFIFEECLQKTPPWYVIRNIVFMISEIGDSSLFYLIEDYLHHPDIRVQKEVIDCIEKLGGDKIKDRYLLALKKVNDELKIGLVMKLNQFPGNDVAIALLDLFEKRAQFSDTIRKDLLSVLCIALKSYPNPKAVKVLSLYLNELKKARTSPDHILIAEEVLSVIKPKVRHDLKTQVASMNEPDFDYDPVSTDDAKRRINTFLDEIQQVVGKGDVGKASEMMYSEAVRAARNKDFIVAEILRDRILEINPIALSEVLEIGEIIEEEKNSSISPDHLEVWNDLYDEMTTEEFNALYAAMKRETYDPDETIIESGEMDPSLFFVNSGTVQLSCTCGNKETFLKRLQPGKIMGVGPFFFHSLWTVSLVSQNTTQINVLERERFNKIRENLPELEEKLHKYCLQFDTVPTLLRMTGGDRREYARYRLSLNVAGFSLDPYGRKKQYTLEGNTIDFSRGGLAFYVDSPRGIKSKNLLGRQIIAEIRLQSGDTLKYLGVVVGVGYPQNDTFGFLVHIKFSNMMKSADFEKLSRNK